MISICSKIPETQEMKRLGWLLGAWKGRVLSVMMPFASAKIWVTRLFHGHVSSLSDITASEPWPRFPKTCATRWKQKVSPNINGSMKEWLGWRHSSRTTKMFRRSRLHQIWPIVLERTTLWLTEGSKMLWNVSTWSNAMMWPMYSWLRRSFASIIANGMRTRVTLKNH